MALRYLNLLPLLTLSLAVPAPAQTRPATDAAPTLLQQLNNDTRTLYLTVRTGLVRVQLPTPRWLEQLNARHDLLEKWGPQLSPEVREQLARQQMQRERNDRRPGTQPASTRAVNPLVLLTTGMLIDDAGHAVVPLFVDAAALGTGPLRVELGDGNFTTARFLGSDRKTNITVLQLATFPHQRVKLNPSRPPVGSLVMVIGPDGACRLGVWSNLHVENGLIVMPDASVAGFGFAGQFLGAAACKPLVDQVVQTGRVHRAVLGVRVQEVAWDDVVRRQRSELGDRPALVVLQVDPDSAADRGRLCAGDMILSVAQQAVGDGPTFAAVIASRRGVTPLAVLRQGRVLKLQVELHAD